MPAPRTPDAPRSLDRLQCLIDRLSAPNLTIAESQDLRPILLRLLESIEVERTNRGTPGAGHTAAREASRCAAV